MQLLQQADQKRLLNWSIWIFYKFHFQKQIEIFSGPEKHIGCLRNYKCLLKAFAFCFYI
jgi:hypothetical protein